VVNSISRRSPFWRRDECDGRGWFRTSDLSRAKRGRGEQCRRPQAIRERIRLRLS
jgi:hypothetical protein